MTTDPDAIDLLRELRPDPGEFDPDAPHAFASLERILATPPPGPPRPRWPWRLRLALATTMAVVAAAAVALAPARDGSPDVLANAVAALAEPDVIWHFKTVSPRPNAERSEGWVSADGRKKRQLRAFDGGSAAELVMEFVTDFDTKTHLVYVPERDVFIRTVNPEWDFPAEGPRSADDDGPIDIIEVKHLFERARDGDDRVKLAGEATVRGIPTYELRVAIEVPIPTEIVRCYGGPDARRYTRVIYVDQERYLPVRIVQDHLSWAPEAEPHITDYVEVKALPRTPATETLLEMTPHPGAKEKVEDWTSDKFRCPSAAEKAEMKRGLERLKRLKEPPRANRERSR